MESKSRWAGAMGGSCEACPSRPSWKPFPPPWKPFFPRPWETCPSFPALQKYYVDYTKEKIMEGKHLLFFFCFVLMLLLVYGFFLSVPLVAARNIRRSVPVWKTLCHADLKTGDLILFGPQPGDLTSFWFSHAPGLRRRMLDRDGHLLSFRHTAVVVVKKNGFPQLIHVHGKKKTCITIQDYLDGEGGDVFVRQCPDHLRPPLTKVQQWIMEHESLRLVPSTNILFWLFGPMLGICLAHKPNERICSQMCYEFFEDMGLTGTSKPQCKVLITPQTLGDQDEIPWLGPLKRVVLEKK